MQGVTPPISASHQPLLPPNTADPQLTLLPLPLHSLLRDPHAHSPPPWAGHGCTQGLPSTFPHTPSAPRRPSHCCAHTMLSPAFTAMSRRPRTLHLQTLSCSLTASSVNLLYLSGLNRNVWFVFPESLEASQIQGPVR